MKKIVSLFLVLVMVIGVFAVTPADAASLKEDEDNDTESDADYIALGDSLTGEINTSFDWDYYYLVSNEDGKINLNIDLLNPEEKEGYKWIYALVYTIDHTQVAKVKIDLATKSTVVMPFIGAKTGNYYYLVLFPGHGRCEGTEYRIRTSFTKGDYYEKEANNIESTATDIIPGHDYVGTIGAEFTDDDGNDCYDNDYYHIQMPAKGKLTVTFKHKKRTTESLYCGWDFLLYHHYNGGNSSLSHAQFTLDSDESTDLGSGMFEKDKELWIWIRSGRELYYHAHEPSDCQGEPYTVSTSFVLAAKPAVTVKTTKDSVKLTSEKLSDITGYQIQKLNGKNYGDTKTVKKTALTYSDTGLKANTAYTYRVRAYLHNNDTDYYGEWVEVTAKTAKASGQTVFGDADDDGMVTIMDATRIQRVIADLETDISFEAADVDGDGTVTILDATRIQRYIAGLSTLDGTKLV